jgi:single-stranded-DNA-specific exonuclease
MVEKQAFSLGEVITPIGIAFYIAPYMNAMCRSGTQEEKRLMFEAMLEFKSYEILPSTKRGCKGQTETRVEQACRTCTNVKNRQTRSRDQSTETIEQLIEEQNLLENKILAIKLDKEHSIDVNLTGLIANRLMAQFQRPVMLLNEVEEDGKIYWRGSCRGYDKSALKDFRAFLEESGLTEWNQGHANAFGSSVADENFEALIKYSNEKLKDFDFTPKYNVDIIFNYNDISPNDVMDIADYRRLWGQTVEEPYIVVENVPVYADNLALMKGTTLKITTPTMELIKFGSSNEEYESLYSKLGCVIINVVGTCEINSWNGKPQIKIEDYEIIKKQQYYF